MLLVFFVLSFVKLKPVKYNAGHRSFQIHIFKPCLPCGESCKYSCINGSLKPCFKSTYLMVWHLRHCFFSPDSTESTAAWPSFEHFPWKVLSPSSVSTEERNDLLFQAEAIWHRHSELCVQEGDCWRDCIVLGCRQRKPTQKLSSAWLFLPGPFPIKLNEKEHISRVYC